MSDPTPPAGSEPDPDEADTVATPGDEAAGPEPARSSAAPPPAVTPPPAPMSPRMSSAARSRWLPQLAIAILILVLGIGIGAAGTIGVSAIARHFHHRGPVIGGPGFERHGPPFRRLGPGQRPVRPLPGRPANPVTPATPAPSPTG